MSRTLHLTVTKEWFIKILAGEKMVDFREIKPYWTKRLTNGKDFKKYDFIKIRNGYSKKSPLLLCLFDSIRITRKNEKTDLGIGKFYAIKIDRIIGSDNTQGLSHE